MTPGPNNDRELIDERISFADNGIHVTGGDEKLCIVMAACMYAWTLMASKYHNEDNDALDIDAISVADRVKNPGNLAKKKGSGNDCGRNRC